MLNLNIRRVKGTQYKLVLSGWSIVGIFDNEVFYSKQGMTDIHKSVCEQWHAGTFKERMLSLQEN